jgi:predicted TIM-barrel fold metal-dependent hydrolase
MPSRQLDFEVFDTDNHLYEDGDALTKFLPEKYRGAVDYIQQRGRTKIAFQGHISEMIPNPTFDRLAAPGTLEDYFRARNQEGKTYRELVGKTIGCPPAFRYPAPRLELMDEQGIDRSLMFPTLASLVEERMRNDVHLTHAVMHALNEWLYETWSFNYEDRIFATPIITLPVVDKAIEELEWCLERGARTVLIRPAPVPSPDGGSRSPGLPEFDPFWEAVVNAGIPVAMHASDSGYMRHVQEWEGGSEFLPFTANAFRNVSMGHRAIEDACAALVCHGAAVRFPDLRFAVVENGSGFVRPLLESLERTYNMMPQEFAEHPVTTFRRNFYVHPFHEDDVHGIVEAIGDDHVLFGSDFPHPEGLADPITYVDELEGLPAESVRKIMGGNIAGLLGVASVRA